MNIGTRGAVSVLVAFIAFAPAVAQDFVAKTYEFKANVRLEVGLDLGEGLRLESIQFELTDDAPDLFGMDPRAKVVISNLGTESRRVGIAIALEDGTGRLVAAGTGGTKLFPLRAERQMAYGISFSDVRSRIHTAEVFRITLETD